MISQLKEEGKGKVNMDINKSFASRPLIILRGMKREVV